jgi:hypothetical protein
VPPALTAVLSQLAGAALAAGIAYAGLVPPQPLALALTQGVCAATVAFALRSARWWLPIHLAFMPLAVAAAGLHVPPALYLVAFAVLLLVYGSSWRTQVPLFLSNQATLDAVVALLPSRPICLLDLGSGTGALVRGLARQRPDCRFVGIESSIAPHGLATWRARGRQNLELRRGDFFETKWSGFDVVYAFLSPVPMQRVWDKAAAEMDDGALLISNSFIVPGIEPESVIEVGDRRATRLYCYRAIK